MWLEQIKGLSGHARIPIQTPQPSDITVAEASKNRHKAIARGEITYIGRRCIRGHEGVRYSVSKKCVQCDKEVSARNYLKRKQAK